MQTHCIFCTDGSHGWHLGFNLEGGGFNCWRCGGHSTNKFLYKYFKKHEVGQILQAYQTAGMPKVRIKRDRPSKAVMPPQLEPLRPIHRKYLLKRNFNVTAVEEEWELRSTIGFSGEWSWRIVTPVKNSLGKIVAYTGRALRDEVNPRWKMSADEEIAEDPKKLIYGIEKAKDRILIVEGISDVWRMGPGAVALMGINWKEEQAHILKDYLYRAIMFDPEKEAQRQAQDLANWLAPFKGETEIITDLSSDPGDLSQKEADHIMKELGII